MLSTEKAMPVFCHLQISCSQISRSSNMTTLPYPGFPTDLQPQFMTLLTTCAGEGIVEETVFESRMRHGKSLAT